MSDLFIPNKNKAKYLWELENKRSYEKSDKSAQEFFDLCEKMIELCTFPSANLKCICGQDSFFMDSYPYYNHTKLCIRTNKRKNTMHNRKRKSYQNREMQNAWSIVKTMFLFSTSPTACLAEFNRILKEKYDLFAQNMLKNGDGYIYIKPKVKRVRL